MSRTSRRHHFVKEDGKTYTWHAGLRADCENPACRDQRVRLDTNAMVVEATLEAQAAAMEEQ